MNQPIHVLQLYPRDMNIYGDFGNTLVLQRRLALQGFDPIVDQYDPGDAFPDTVDIIVGGGGQDSGQGKIQEDLLVIGPRLIELAEQSTPMVVICGLYQMYGKFFKTSDGTVIEGIGLLDVETYGKSKRLIGNVHVNSDEFGELIGYENHSGQTFLGDGVKPLGTVTLGEGNNADDKTEGAIYKNVIGTYLHGSLLPKNPAISDFLIREAVEKRYGDGAYQPEAFDDPYTAKARETAMQRPR